MDLKSAREQDDDDRFGAFIQRLHLRPAPNPSPSPPLPLHGLTFSVKDIFDIAGYVTGFGNPDWGNTHAAATSTAPAVLALIEAGATCVGKTVMDEMAYSINGENKHYGTPVNPAAPDRVPGGSSSGSTVSVAANLVDFSLGTDTGGSVRVPAAYCGIFGFRPSHAVVSNGGVVPMAQSFDTVGWFARDPEILKRVGHVLLSRPQSEILSPTKVIIPNDCFQILSFQGDQTSQVLMASVEKILGGHILQYENLGCYITAEVPSLKTFMVDHSGDHGPLVSSLLALSSAMRLLQRVEFRNNHGDWVKTVRPEIGSGISERVWEAITATDENLDKCLLVRSELQVALDALLKDSGILAIPTVPGPPPKLLTEVSALESFRAKAFSLLAIAGMSGFCQVTIPLGMHDNLPVSVSMIAKHGADLFLLNFAQTLYDSLREQGIITTK